jgi:hypothetical protein
MTRITTTLIVMFCVLGTAAGVQADFAGMFETYPLPIKVEGNAISSTCYLTIKVYKFNNRSSVALASATKDDPELVLSNFLKSIREADLESFKELSAPEENLEAVFSMYRRILDGSDDPILVQRFDIGGLSYFLLDVGKSQYPVVPVLIMRKQGKYLQSYSSIGHAVCQNVSALSRAIVTAPHDFTPVSNAQYNTEVSLLPLFGDSHENPVYFRFTGFRVSYPVFSDTSAGETYSPCLKEPLQFYREVSYALAKKATDSYAYMFGPKSKVKVTRFVDKMKRDKPHQFQEYLRVHTSYRQVSYVISSGRLLILFHQPYRGDYKGEGLQYDMIFNYQDSGMKQVNFFFESNIDGLFQWEQFATRFIADVINVEQ